MNNETTFLTVWASIVETVCHLLSPHGAPLVEGGAKSYLMSDFSLHFFLQIAVIIMTCRVVGWLGQKFLGQPQVVGEMIAGVILGPSVIGYFFPEFSAALFPNATKSVLYVGAQFGVGLYMFLVGTTFHLDHFKANRKKAFAVSFAGIAVPFLVAVLITPYLMTIPGLFAPTISTSNATLFLGACIALTAFPMLARIINERGLSKSSLGTLSLTAGAFDDACSWCVLAIVLATFGAGPGVAVLAIGGGILYSLFICFFGTKLLAPLGKIVEREGGMSHQVLAIVLVLFSLSAFIMDAVGIHAIFGGFILGTAMPRGKFVAELKKKVEPLAVVFFLPMFFTYSGLNTMMNVMNTPFLMLVALEILVASVAAKGVACYVAARLCGEDNRTALAIGALMNSRGLMELIIINIGLEKGIIGQGLFSMLVLMAIVTTLMTTPIFEFVYGRRSMKLLSLILLGGLFFGISVPLISESGISSPEKSSLSKKPFGIYALCPPDKVGQATMEPAKAKIWGSPGLEGIALRTFWDKLERTENNRDWSYFDAGVEAARQHHKSVSLSIASGIFTPDWVFEIGVARFQITAKSNYGLSKVRDVPLPGDSLYLEKWGRLVREMGERYDQNPTVGYVVIGGVGMVVETYFAKEADDFQRLNKVGGSAAWLEGAKKVVDLFIKAFPTTPVILAMGEPFPGPEGKQRLEELVSYGLKTYPGHFGLMHHGLTAVSGREYYPNAVIADNSATTTVGFQMVWSTEGPWAKLIHGSLETALQHGVDLKAQFIEVYAEDFLTNRYGSLFEKTNQQLRTNASR